MRQPNVRCRLQNHVHGRRLRWIQPRVPPWLRPRLPLVADRNPHCGWRRVPIGRCLHRPRSSASARPAENPENEFHPEVPEHGESQPPPHCNPWSLCETTVLGCLGMVLR
ncbi:TilS substrate C-terminal domain-containing protein [Acidovorax soli]|uniref:TilS substrate C-terminal domain-containing protein n=1 Tax=Acidovorax soli TaxID=592050 RepID=UPI003CC7AF26